MNIKETFLKLTSQTYPYGYEDSLVHFLPKGYKMDIDGNYYYEVGTGSKNIFTCHLDTACKLHTDVTHRIDGKFIKTDGKTILGADDKAGMTIVLYMIEKNVPGLYYFFVGEEVGCIGSTAASKRIEFFSNYNKIISFDRRGTNSIITHQSSKRSCSDEFADSLSKEFAKHNMNLEKDDTGVYTDSAEFVEIIPECTNISVGYYKEHTYDEHQDIEFLENLAKSVVLINWDSLEVKRDPSKKEWKQWKYGNYYNNANFNQRSSWRDDEYEYYPKRSSRTRRGSGKSGKSNTIYSGFDEWVKKNPKGNVIDYYNSLPAKQTTVNSAKVDEQFIINKYNKKGKVYYNDLENEIPDIKNISEYKSDYYKGVRPLFLDDQLTVDEFSIIKDQCLNMNDASDIDFAKFMEASLI